MSGSLTRCFEHRGAGSVSALLAVLLRGYSFALALSSALHSGRRTTKPSGFGDYKRNQEVVWPLPCPLRMIECSQQAR